MSNIINIHTRQERESEPKVPDLTCCICKSDFDIEEGGTAGYFGICLVHFCPWCLTSMIDMVRQLTNNFEEDRDKN